MLRFKVEGMSCGHCVRAVGEAVKAIDPGAEVRVDLAAGSVQVAGRATAEAVAAAIRSAGYQATPLAG